MMRFLIFILLCFTVILAILLFSKTWFRFSSMLLVHGLKFIFLYMMTMLGLTMLCKSTLWMICILMFRMMHAWLIIGFCIDLNLVFFVFFLHIINVALGQSVLRLKHLDWSIWKESLCMHANTCHLSLFFIVKWFLVLNILFWFLKKMRTNALTLNLIFFYWLLAFDGGRKHTFLVYFNRWKYFVLVDWQL